MSTPLLVLTAFLASAVEMVEAVTIILAVGLTRGWRAALVGTAAGLLVLAAVVAALGPALVRLVPLAALQVVIGTLLLIFGLQWLRKAILRAAGRKAKHDEEAIFREELDTLGGTPESAAFDWLGFTVAFKGVLLEGLEVVFIVIAFGSAQGHLGLAVAGAAAALVVVVVAGVLARGPLSRVPENTIKFAVGLLLTTFGCFWAAEGAGVEWPGDELSLLGVLAFFAAVSFVLVRSLRRRRTLVPAGAEA